MTNQAFSQGQLVDYETGSAESGKGRIEQIDEAQGMASVRDEDDNSLWRGPLDKLSTAEIDEE